MEDNTDADVSPTTKMIEQLIGSNDIIDFPLSNDLQEVIFQNVPKMQTKVTDSIEAMINDAAKYRSVIENSSRDLLHNIIDEPINQPKLYFVDGTYNINTSYMYTFFFIGTVSISDKEETKPKKAVISDIITGSDLIDFAIGPLTILSELRHTYSLLRDETDCYVFIDMSFISLITQLNRLSTLYDMYNDNEIWKIEEINGLLEFYRSDFLKDIFESNRVFALPKITSKSEIQQQIFGNYTGFTDSALFTTLLKSNEFILHSNDSLRKLKRGNIGQKSTKLLLGQRNFILDFYINYGFHFVYLRGYDWAPAIRIEVPNSFIDYKSALSSVSNLVSIIYTQMKYPELRQPYLMYIVDMLAKQLYAGSIALKSAINDPLAETILSKLKNVGVLFQEYR